MRVRERRCGFGREGSLDYGAALRRWLSPAATSACAVAFRQGTNAPARIQHAAAITPSGRPFTTAFSLSPSSSLPSPALPFQDSYNGINARTSRSSTLGYGDRAAAALSRGVSFADAGAKVTRAAAALNALQRLVDPETARKEGGGGGALSSHQTLQRALSRKQSSEWRPGRGRGGVAARARRVHCCLLLCCAYLRLLRVGAELARQAAARAAVPPPASTPSLSNAATSLLSHRPCTAFPTIFANSILPYRAHPGLPRPCPPRLL